MNMIQGGRDKALVRRACGTALLIDELVDIIRLSVSKTKGQLTQIRKN